MLKDTFANLMFALVILISIIWPFLVFFHFIWFGLVLLIGFSAIGAIIYFAYKEFIAIEHKLTHHKPH